MLASRLYHLKHFMVESVVHLFVGPRYVVPFTVLKKVGSVAYKLELCQEPSRVHNTFHVSNLKKCYADEPLAVLLDGLHIDDKLHFVEELVEIMDREVKRLKQSRILIIKVRWNFRRGPEFTWKREDQFRKKYPHLFTKTASLSNFVMSDSEQSTVTYTSISSDYEEPSDVGSPRVMVYGYDGLPMHPQSPDYVPEPENPPSLDYVPGPEYPPSPILGAATVCYCLTHCWFLGYITESDPNDDPEEDDEDPEKDPADYPTDKDDDDDEEESYKDNASDKEEDKDEDEEEEEHLAPTDFAHVDKLLTIPTPPSSPLPRIPSLPFHVPSPLPTSPTDTRAPLGYRAAMIRLRAESPSTSHPLPLPPPIILPRTPPLGTPPLLPIPLPTSLPPLLLPSTECRSDVPEVTLLPWKRLCIALGLRFEVGECSTAPTARPTGGFRSNYGFVGTLDAEIRRSLDREIGYRITDIWEDPDEIAEEILATDVAELGQRMTDFLNLLRRDRCSHAYTARLMESEAKASREAWIQSMDASDMARSEVRALRTTILAQQTEIGDLRAGDRRRQAQLAEALTLLRTLQTQMAALQSQQRPARDPTHLDVSEEAGSIIFSYDLKKMSPTKRTTRASLATTTTTTPVTNVLLKAQIDLRVVDALAARDADRSRNGDESYN
ncbi:hypothetical protein Tco_0312581 [Tanacetum coccineum]